MKKLNLILITVLTFFSSVNAIAAEWIIDTNERLVAFRYEQREYVSIPGLAIFCDENNIPFVFFNFSGYKSGTHTYQLSLDGETFGDPDTITVDEPDVSGNPRWDFEGTKAKQISQWILNTPGGVISNNNESFKIPSSGADKASAAVKNCT